MSKIFIQNYCDVGTDHHFKSDASLSASTPGNFIPCINYKDAPPPVETYDTSSWRLALLTKLAVSPPPMIEVAPSFVF